MDRPSHANRVAVSGAEARGRAARRRGLSLIEAIAALVVIAVFVPTTMVGLHDARVRAASVELMSRAKWLAAERLEDVTADRHAPGRGYAYILTSAYPFEASISGFPGFSRSVAVAEVGPGLSAGVGHKRVSVTVQWTDPLRGVESLTLETIVSDHP